MNNNMQINIYILSSKLPVTKWHFLGCLLCLVHKFIFARISNYLLSCWLSCHSIFSPCPLCSGEIFPLLLILFLGCYPVWL
jgi:hypothetical protein